MAAAELRRSNPSKVPVICTAAEGVERSPRLKYLIHNALTLHDLLQVLQKDAKANRKGEADALRPASALLDEQTGDAFDLSMRLKSFDEKFCSADGFCRVIYSAKNEKMAPHCSMHDNATSASPVMPGTQLTACTPFGPPVTRAFSSRYGDAPAAPPHDNLPEGATMASCTFLNPRGAGSGRTDLVPSNGGRVPSCLYLVVFMDMCAVGLVIPLLSSYSRALGGTALTTGVLQASYGAAQLLGANFFGGLSDRLGRRRVLQLSMLGGVFGYASLAAAVGPVGSLSLLLVSRMPIGLFKQSMTAARALVADCTTATTRVRHLMRLGAAVGAGFILGPGLGGVLAKRFGPAFPPLIAVVLFALAFLLCGFVRETAPIPISRAELRTLRASIASKWTALCLTPRAVAAHQRIAHANDVTSPSSGESVARTKQHIVHGGDADDLRQALKSDRSLTHRADGFDLESPLMRVCRDILSEWRPHGQPLTEPDFDALLAAWQKLLAARAHAHAHAEETDGLHSAHGQASPSALVQQQGSDRQATRVRSGRAGCGECDSGGVDGKSCDVSGSSGSAGGVFDHGSTHDRCQSASPDNFGTGVLAARACVTAAPAAAWEELKLLSEEARTARPSDAVASDRGDGGPEIGVEIGLDVVDQTLCYLYLLHKETRGMLHGDAVQELWTDTFVAAESVSRSWSRSTSALRRLLAVVRDDAATLWVEPTLHRLRQLLLGRSLLELALISLHSIFADYTSTKFGWGARANGMAMAYSGLLSIVADLVVLPSLYNRRVLSELQMVLGGALLSAVGFVSAASSASPRGFAAALAILAVGTALSKSAAAALILNASARHRSGQVSGAVDALEACCRVLSPLGAAFAFESFGREAPLAAACSLCLAGAAVFAEATPQSNARIRSKTEPGFSTDSSVAKKSR